MKKEEPKKSSKKAVWQVPHKCVACGKENSGYLLCPHCGKMSIKGGEKS